MKICDNDFHFHYLCFSLVPAHIGFLLYNMCPNLWNCSFKSCETLTLKPRCIVERSYDIDIFILLVESHILSKDMNDHNTSNMHGGYPCYIIMSHDISFAQLADTNWKGKKVNISVNNQIKFVCWVSTPEIVDILKRV